MTEKSFTEAGLIINLLVNMSTELS